MGMYKDIANRKRCQMDILLVCITLGIGIVLSGCAIMSHHYLDETYQETWTCSEKTMCKECNSYMCWDQDMCYIMEFNWWGNGARTDKLIRSYQKPVGGCLRKKVDAQ